MVFGRRISTFFIIIIIIIYLTETITTFEITYETDIDSLPWPVQVSNPENPFSFFRIYRNDNTIEEIFCPEGTIFDSIELKCTQTNRTNSETTTTTTTSIGTTIENCNGQSGQFPYPDDCRQYIDCWFGYGYLRQCQNYLLFSPKVRYCDWPLTANCCEYIEEDPNQIVD